MSPASRRAFLPGLMKAFAGCKEVTQRWLCDLLLWSRSTMRYRERPKLRDERLKPVLARLAVKLPRFGFRRIHNEVLKAEKVCLETIQRLWKTMQLQVPLRPRRPRRVRTPAAIRGLRARNQNHVWCLDFLLDKTRGGRKLRFLSVVDEYTRICLALEVSTRFPAEDVVAVLSRLVAIHGRPMFIRSDNGPEFIATVVREWADKCGILLVRSAPASPWQNPFAETFHSRLRDELVEREDFGSLAEARVLAEAYRVWYNNERPHSSLGYQTPTAFSVRGIATA